MTDDTRAPLTAQEIEELRKWLHGGVEYWSGPRGNDPEWVAACTNALRALDELEALKREMDSVRERNVGIRCEGCGKAWTDDGESWQSWEDAWTCPACSA